jgi:hypothetical protein
VSGSFIRKSFASPYSPLTRRQRTEGELGLDRPLGPCHGIADRPTLDVPRYDTSALRIVHNGVPNPAEAEQDNAVAAAAVDAGYAFDHGGINAPSMPLSPSRLWNARPDQGLK